MYIIQHNPARLHNCDETSITIVQNKHTKILGLKGKCRISSVQSAERGYVMTVANCMSPTGQFIPPLLVFPRKCMKPELINGTPPGSIHAHHPSEWIRNEIFSQWFLHFIKHTKPTKEDPFILIPEGTIHTQGTWRSLIWLERIMLTYLPPTSQQSQNATLG
jgi:hypothetical protein